MESKVSSLRQSFFYSLNSSKSPTSSDWNKLGDLVDRFENTKIVDRDEESNHRRGQGRCKSSMTSLKNSKPESDWDKLGDLIEKLEDPRLGKPPFASLNSSKPVTESEKLGDLVDKLENTKNSDRDEKINQTGDKEKFDKHPLQNAWTYWFFMFDDLSGLRKKTMIWTKNQSKNWTNNQRQIHTVSTVEDFWSLYNRLEVSSELPEGASYSIFKEGIFPGWEDPRNQDGGRWIISLNSNSKFLSASTRTQNFFLDTHWLELVLFLIGEQADQYAHQVGI